MADPVAAGAATGAGTGVATISTWAGAEVRVADVLGALEELRCGGRAAASRTSVLTLVIVADSEARAEWAVQAVHELGGRHPARTICLVPDPAAEPGLSAAIALQGAEADGRRVYFEDVQLHVRGPAARHLDSLIEPFTLPDLPVVVWFVDDLPVTGDPLLTAADVLLIDARELADVEVFGAVRSLTEIRPVVDLSWVRLRPWRTMLAALFEGHEMAAFAGHVRHARVQGKTGPRHLLGGWLVERLDLPLPELELITADHAAIRLTAEAGGRVAHAEVSRPGDERVVIAAGEVEGGPHFHSTVPLPPRTPGWGLAEALARLHRDPVYERAIAVAVHF